MYESYYQLSARPFQLSPDPRFFFGSRGHKRAKAYLQYGLHQGEGFIIITGDVGTGKTTLVRTLFAELTNQNVVAAQLVTTQLEAEDMLRMVAASFGLAHETANKATLLKNLETFFAARAREGKRVLLIVDEAQNLPPRSLEELRMLSNFQIAGRPLLQCFLLGQEEFRKTLASDGLEQLRQRVIAAYHLTPLSPEETKAYIEHRLRLVGWNNNPTFTDDAYEAIHKFTGGTPRRINTLCDRLLLFGSLEDLRQISEEAVTTVTDELLEEKPHRHGVSANGGTEPGGLPLDAEGAATLSQIQQQLESLTEKLDQLQENLRNDQERLFRFILKAVLHRSHLAVEKGGEDLPRADRA